MNYLSFKINGNNPESFKPRNLPEVKRDGPVIEMKRRVDTIRNGVRVQAAGSSIIVQALEEKRLEMAKEKAGLDHMAVNSVVAQPQMYSQEGNGNQIPVSGYEPAAKTDMPANVPKSPE